MAYEISFTSKKGGVGKTTLAINFAFYLANKKKKVDFVNLDSQNSVKDFFQKDNKYIKYLENESSSSNADFIIYDHPPSATLSHKARGLVILIGNPSRLAIKDAFVAIANNTFKFYAVVLNRFQANSKGHNLIRSDLMSFINERKKSKASRCVMTTALTEAKVIQNIENECNTLFNATESQKKFYNYDKTKSMFTKFFDNIVEKSEKIKKFTDNKK